MGDLLENSPRTEIRDVDGLTVDVKPGQNTKMRMHRITVRVTKDAKGKSISLADELRGIMLEVPCEPIMDLMKWVTEE